MDTHDGSKLTPAQERAALLLAQGHRARDTADQLEVSEQTIGRWKRNPAFQSAMVAAGESIDATVRERTSVFSSRLFQAKERALAAVEDQLDSENAMVVLKAAEILLKA